jgi:hydroxypyruvate reductase
MIALVISDVPGDPLKIIASGPTVADDSTPQEAVEILERYGARKARISATVFNTLSRKAETKSRQTSLACQVTNFVIGNNATAVDAAGLEAERLGYAHAMSCAANPEGPVETIGRHLADMALMMRSSNGPNCLISGGEGTVKLISEAERGLGGRNQQTVLAALLRLMESEGQTANPAGGIAILSAGTDGEDGPTDAAGAFVDSAVIEEARRRGLEPADFLRRNDAYRFFEPLDALIKTGPTNTNVCDVRVVLVEREKAAGRKQKAE